MKSKLISFILALCLLIAIPLEARYKYNPFTRKLDYYETGADIDLGDLADVTLTGLATGNVLYYDGSAWVNLATGANTNVLTLAGGVPTWAAPGAPAAHAVSHEVGGADLVDHNLLTNYVANEHIDHTAVTLTAAGLITGGGTIAANRTFTLTEATIEAAIDSLPNLTQMATPWTKVFVVDAGGGGDYATIQAALNAQNAGGETFLVAPGTYTDTISFTANDQVVKPLGHAANVTVTQADANIVDAGTYTDCIIEGIEIRLTAPTTAINAIQVGTGWLILIECRGYLATAVALAQVDQPALIGFTDAGTIRIKRGNYQYYHTGNAGGTGVKAAFRANQNLAELHLHKVDVIAITNSGTASITALYTTTGTAVTEMHNCVDAVVTDPNATYVVGLGYIGGSGADNVQGNHIIVVATNNIAYGIWHAGTATVRSSFNAFHVSDVAGSSYAFNVGASATLNSHFDDLRSDDGNSVAGTLNMVASEVDADLTITDELDVGGVSEFSGDTNQYEDVFITWADALDKMVISQSSTAHTEDQPLILIDDDRDDEHAVELSEATIIIDADGYYALYIADGMFYIVEKSTFAGNVDFNEDVKFDWSDSADHVVIKQNNAAGIENQPLVEIADDREGVTVDEKGEATLALRTETSTAWALWVSPGQSQFDGDTIQTGDIFWTWADTIDNAVIAQSNTAGIEDVPLIFIDDDRVGATATEEGEATIVMDTEGTYALYIADGYMKVEDRVYFNGRFYPASMYISDDVLFRWGTGNGWLSTFWDANGTGDGLFMYLTTAMVTANQTEAFFYSNLNPDNMTDHDNYLSPTLIITNDEAADANDYAGVVIGERTQASVLVAHYFDFYAMTGAADGATNPANAELAAIFRFGASGGAVPTHAQTPGDVLFEGSIEVDGNINIDGEVFQGTYVVTQVVNFDDGSPVAICSVADGYVVTDVYVEVTTTWDGNGTITIGDGDDTDGFIRDADIDQTTAAYYGWHLDERGDYLWDGPDHGDHKVYTGADTVDATLVPGTSTQGIATVYVHITRLK